MNEEEDLAVLIYKTSKTARARAEAAADKEKSRTNASFLWNIEHQLERDLLLIEKMKCKLCSSDGCTNFVVKGASCDRHGAKEKRCNSEGWKDAQQR